MNTNTSTNTGPVAPEEKAFLLWMHKVDLAVSGKFGLSAADLPDAPYRDWHEDGLSPSAAASRAVAEAYAG